MSARGGPRLKDDAVAAIARRFKVEAAATLVTVCRDESAPAAARAAAAGRLLEFAEGRPAQARQPVAADVATMADDERFALLRALLDHFDHERPGYLRELFTRAYVDAEAIKQGLPRRFTRGSPTPRPPHVPPPREPKADGGGSGAPKPPGHPPHRQPPPTPEPSPPAAPAPAQGFRGPSLLITPIDHDAAGRPLRRIGDEPPPGCESPASIRDDIVARSARPIAPAAIGASGRDRG